MIFLLFIRLPHILVFFIYHVFKKQVFINIKFGRLGVEKRKELDKKARANVIYNDGLQGLWK